MAIRCPRGVLVVVLLIPPAACAPSSDGGPGVGEPVATQEQPIWNGVSAQPTPPEVAVLPTHDVIDPVLRHLALPLGRRALRHPDTVAYEVTDE
jgi:hypothetical protein